jgi:Chalcone isomerase-like
VQRRRIILTWALAWSALCARAQPARPELAALTGVQPRALTRLSVWGFDVYDARLWTAPGFEVQQYAKHAFALELQYLRKLQGQAIAERSLEEMRRLAQLPQDKAQAWLETLRSALPDVAPGDRIVGIHLPGQGAEFWFNGRRVAQVPDTQFAPLFFGIWLDGRTSEPQLRARLTQGLQP